MKQQAKIAGCHLGLHRETVNKACLAHFYFSISLKTSVALLIIGDPLFFYFFSRRWTVTRIKQPSWLVSSIRIHRIVHFRVHMEYYYYLLLLLLNIIIRIRNFEYSSTAYVKPGKDLGPMSNIAITKASSSGSPEISESEWYIQKTFGRVSIIYSKLTEYVFYLTRFYDPFCAWHNFVFLFVLCMLIAQDVMFQCVWCDIIC